MKDTCLFARTLLSDGDIVELRKLAEACDQADGIAVKLNWSMIAERDGGRINDFCYYEGGELVGFMPMDDFGGKYEITAVVAPGYRRRGIFRAMYEAALREIRSRGASELLLVNYRASEAGCAAVKRLSLPYASSEYCMEALAAEMPRLPPAVLQLERVTATNVSEVSRMLRQSFDNERWSAVESLLRELDNADKRYYVARLEGEAIGQIGIIMATDRVYIRAVGIVPQWRRKGYGRQLLAATLQKLLNEGRDTFELDVATDNDQALSLYTSCGFRQTNVYDYYAVPLQA